MGRDLDAMTSEADILKHAKKECRRLGLRFIRMSMARGVEVGWMDVIIVGPNAGTLWMETKAPGKPAKPIQLFRAEELRDYGHVWCKPDTKEQVTWWLEQFKAACEGRMR